MSDARPGPPPGAAATAWISRGFEELVARRDAEPAPDIIDFDVVIVGSGYGGAIAAAGLAGATDADGRKISVCVLERGREYLPGMFPPRLSDLAGHVRFSAGGATCARGEREGLFDMRIGADVGAVVANGLGGGSLINAGVMAEPVEEVFRRPEWPETIRKEFIPVRNKWFSEVKVLLGAALPRAVGDPEPNTVLLNPDRVPRKYRVLERMAQVKGKGSRPFYPASITVALTPGRKSSAGVALNECLRCGDCATGCNHGAKDSLDVNLLRTAERAGARLYTGATVLRLARHKVDAAAVAKRRRRGAAHDARKPADAPDNADDAAGNVWILDVVHTEARLRARQGGPFRLVARRVILAAGTFGSTEILLRSRCDDLVFSARLGQNFSTNGDMIAVGYDQHSGRNRAPVEVNAIADERKPPSARNVGPTITGIIDLRGEPEQVVVEEMAVPGPLRRVFEEIVTTGTVLRALGKIDVADHTSAGSLHDPCAVDGRAIGRSSIFAVMGNDGAGGSLELVGGSGEQDGDGAIRIRWAEARDLKLFRDQMRTLRALADKSGVDGEMQENPAWQTLPDDMQFLMENKRGPLMTVHPLGGCPMGDVAGPVPIEDGETDADARAGEPAEKLMTQGAVNHLGQVFDGAQPPRRKAVFKTLVVLDGSIVPTALGINPSLTIAALAHRAIDGLRREWNVSPPPLRTLVPSVRPVFAVLPDPKPPMPTMVEVVERVSGATLLPALAGGRVPARIELTLRFKPVPLESWFLPAVVGGAVAPDPDKVPQGVVPIKRKLEVDRARSEVRVFVEQEWQDWHRRAGLDAELAEIAQYTAPISGSMAFLHREPSTFRQRRCRALVAWFFNRGTRDTWQALAQKVTNWLYGVRRDPRFADEETKGGLIAQLKERIRQLVALASHGGEVRLFDYALTIDQEQAHWLDKTIDFSAMADLHKIHGTKRITYGRKSNPWKQLSRLSLDTFPGVAPGRIAPVLEVDVAYLTHIGVPLLRILKQEDDVATIADLGALAGYFLRLLLLVHVWSFRKPDPADPGEPQRLPGMVKGLPTPEITEFDVANPRDGRPVRARLTRYPRPSSKLPPLLMIPGYSASGTSYAHPALDPHAAGYFWDRGRDIWILDMRTSAGMPTARLPWTFEEVALADIPKAVDFIWNATGAQRESGDPSVPARRIDVLVHCMGSVMFSMALLAPPESGDAYFRERAALPERIGRIVLSQIGPVVSFTPDNVLRAYVMSYLRAFLPLSGYEFRIGPSPSLANQLIDRALATMPYPDREFDIENPWLPPCRRTPWVGSRHRMDALYGRDFNVDNMSARALKAIDALFGPLSTDTVAQAIHFARLSVITNHAGRNVFATRENLLERWAKAGPTLSIHGSRNGLYDVSTLARMRKLFVTDLKLDYHTHEFEGMGHQDCLIGKRSREVFDVVEEFLAGRGT